MGPIYMPEPTEEIWTKSAQGFFEKWQFPNCIGSVDGKHVTIKCLNDSGSRNFCYLKKFSVVLMAIVDPDYKFICITPISKFVYFQLFKVCLIFFFQ